jgi:CBS domain-containing protein
MLTVAEIMTREPYSLPPESSLEDARKLMAEHHIRHIPVLRDNGSLVGMVSQRDVLAASASSVTGAAEPTASGATSLATILTQPVQTVDPNASLRGTAMHLQKHKLGCLPVVEDGRVVGIVTDADFVAVAINLMEQLELAEPEETDFNDTEVLA